MRKRDAHTALRRLLTALRRHCRPNFPTSAVLHDQLRRTLRRLHINCSPLPGACNARGKHRRLQLATAAGAGLQEACKGSDWAKAVQRVRGD